jgi:predicted GIY-YIG superfamily endonuclease
MLRSINYPDETYIGISSNPKQRIREHNSGKSPHTSKFKPWEIFVVIGFRNEKKAHAFEKYLKSASGRAFANKRFW